MRLLVFAFTIVFVWTGPQTGRALGFHFQVSIRSSNSNSQFETRMIGQSEETYAQARNFCRGP